jgi:hypothetical protein
MKMNNDLLKKIEADAGMKKLTAPANYQKLYSYIEKCYNRSIK